MDGFEEGESGTVSLEIIDKFILVLTVLEEAFQSVQLGSIVVSHYHIEVAVFVTEMAPFTAHA